MLRAVLAIFGVFCVVSVRGVAERLCWRVGRQGTSQTNEDDLAEEIQTDEVRCRHKWTQHPIQFDVKVTTNAEGEVVSGPTYYVSHAVPDLPRPR